MTVSSSAGSSSGAAADPYVWYPALDKNLIPFHTGAGFWGPQRPIQEAVAPQGPLTDVNVSTPMEMDAALTAGSRRITLTADLVGYVFAEALPVTDIDIIVPPGRLFSNVSIGYAGSTPYPTRINRLRIRGPTVGVYGGGQVHHIGFTCGAGSSDIIIEGLNLTAPGGNNGPVVFTQQNASDLTRVAIHNNKIRSGGWGYLGEMDHLAFVGNAVLTGSGTVEQVEAWGVRHYPHQNFIIFGNDIRSDTVRTTQAYARVRLHPDEAGAYGWIHGNTFIERIEGNVFWLDSAAGHSAMDAGNMGTLWYEQNTVITTGPGGVVFTFGDSDHARVQNNTFQSNTLTSSAGISAGGNGTTPCPDPVFTPNTFQALPASDPPWGGPGDPSNLNWNF